MAKREPGQLLLDGIGALDAGMNAGLVPQLLPPNQVSMSTNMTFRGGYGTHRPPIREIALDFKGDAVLQANVTTNPFQGAVFYQPDTGAQSLVAAIGGRLFQFFPQGTKSTVLDVSIPGDPNPSSPQQAWLWQSERFIIWNDGVSLPVFFDGSISRRSNGTDKVLATIFGTFVAPAVGANVTVTVTQPYTGPTNVPVLVNGNQYVLLSASSTAPSAQAVKYFDPQGAHSLNEPIISYPNRIGYLLQDIQRINAPQTVKTSFLVDTNGNPIPAGIIVTIDGVNFTLGASTVSDPNIPFGWHATTLTPTTPPLFSPQGFPLARNGSIITISSSAPIVTIGTLQTAFTTFADSSNAQEGGVSVPIAINPTYTGPAQIVWINSRSIYSIAPKTFPPTTQVVLQNVGATPGDPVSGDIIALPELPAGRMGAYGMGRNWMALTDGTSFIASDIVGGTSGTAVYNFRDAPLRVTENSYLAGGGAFRIPGALGDIRAMRFNATLDVSLGQGPLQVFTTMAAFSCNAPVDRTTWSNVVNPILTQSLLGSGALSQNGTRQWNNDIMFRSIDGIRSLILARREFDTWGNVPQSREVQTILQQDDATLVQFESLEIFENRALLAVLPTNGPLGVFHQGIIALNADPISTLRGKAPSIYDGLWTGMNVLQLVSGVFNGVERCYAFCFDSVLSQIRLFEIEKTLDNPFDNGTIPPTFSFESASLFTNPKIKGEFDLIELQDGEIYISDVRGVVNIETWYRPNYSDCWTKWTEFGICGNNTDTSKPVQYRVPLGLGTPSVQDCDPNTNQPTRIGLNFQVRFQITGSCKFRGARFKATHVPEPKFARAQCRPLCDVVAEASQDCEPCITQDPCLQFPLVLYNLNANKRYSNSLQTVDVTCPDNTVQQVVVPAGTVNYTLPFSPGSTTDYPPLVMNCLSGGVIVKTIPVGATQDAIDLIVNEMIQECVVAYAQSIATCGTQKLFSSEQVQTTHSCADGETLRFNGTLPSWISIDANTFVITGNAGVVTSDISTEDATAKAQTQLDTWVQAQLDAGNLFCHPAGPSCIVFDSTFNITSASPDNLFIGTHTASVRRAVVSDNNSTLDFIDTSNNTLIAPGVAWSGLSFGLYGEWGCFALSSECFYLPSSGGIDVFSKDGVVITTIALPVNLSAGALTNLVYSDSQDRVYGVSFDGGTGTRHVFAVNPNDNTCVDVFDTGDAGQCRITATPTNLILTQTLFQMASYSFAGALQNTLAGQFAGGGMIPVYDPNSGHVFASLNTFSTPVSFVQVDPVTLTVVQTYVTTAVFGILQGWASNPITGAVVATGGDTTIVVDPIGQSIVCEVVTSPDSSAGTVVDYVSGKTFLYDELFGDNPMNVYQ